MIDKVYSRPIIPLLISMISGIALGDVVPGCRVWAYLLVSTAGGLILCSVVFKPFLKKDFLIPIILFIALGYLLIQPWTSPDFPSNHIIHFTDSNKWKIVGTIDQSVEKIKYRQKFILSAESLEVKNRKFCVTGKIRVTVTGDLCFLLETGFLLPQRSNRSKILKIQEGLIIKDTWLLKACSEVHMLLGRK